MNIHFHLIPLEGIYLEPRSQEKALRFSASDSPTDQEVCDVVEKIATKTIKFLRKKGYLREEGQEVLRPDLDQLYQDHPSHETAGAERCLRIVVDGLKARNFPRNPKVGLRDEGLGRQ